MAETRLMRKYRFASKEKQMWIPALARAMEKLRANMIVFAYQVLYAGRLAQLARSEIDRVAPMHKKYLDLMWSN